MKKYLVVLIVAFVSVQMTAQTKKSTVKRPLRQALSQNSKLKEQPVEVKDTVVVFDFVADTSGVSESSCLKTSLGTNYYVVPFSKKTAHELYNDILVRIAHLYKSPERVTEKVEDKSIVVNGYGNHITKQTSSGFLISVSYKLEFNFKDGKVRVNSPCFSSFDELSMRTGQEFNNLSAGYIWTLGQNNEIDVIHQIEQYFNKLVADLVYGDKNDEDW